MTRANTIIDIDRFFTIDDGCWLWFGPNTGTGPKGKCFRYGTMKIKGKMHKASRLMYEYFYGVKPGALHVLHRCDNPLCVKPSHLFLGTHADNMRDMIAKKRRNFNGERGPAAKISDAMALRIRIDERPNHLIAAEFGVTHATIAKIKRRETFKHL